MSNIPTNQNLLKLGMWLLVGTLAYNLIEAIISITAGVQAKSIALTGFGFDSIIEASAASLVLWRLWIEDRGGFACEIERTEHNVHRFVGFTFFALAVYILWNSTHALWAREAPSESFIGMILAVASLIIMPLLAWGKIQIAKKIQSKALLSEAKETIACSILSLILLLGLGLNFSFGWWWTDPVAALLMIPWLVKEGLEGLKGEGCCS